MILMEIGKIKQKFEDLGKIYEIIVLGSYVQDCMKPTSDIDIAIITRSKSKEFNEKVRRDLFVYSQPQFDVRVFELFSIQIQASIIDNYIVLFGDLPEISDYFYQYRKKWDDCKHRILSNQISSYKEILNDR